MNAKVDSVSIRCDFAAVLRQGTARYYRYGTVRYSTVCHVGRQVFGKQQARGEVKSSEGRRQHSMLLAASTETQRITDQQLDGDPVLRRRWKLDWHGKRKERDRQR